MMNVVYIAHGGGPMPLLGDPRHGQMVDQLQSLAGSLPRPSAVLVISAHWEEPVPTLTSGSHPPLIYDYYGFPEPAYRLTYPCLGDPGLAAQMGEAFARAGVEHRLDGDRGFDHGVFVPLKIMYPDADIPCVQLSLLASLDAEDHLAMGEALQSLECGNLLVIGSGFSFHNMQAFFGRGGDDADQRNELFQVWLENTLTDPELAESARRDRLVRWDLAPHARFCHPREEHLLPLHVCYGLAGQASPRHEALEVLGKSVRVFAWEK
ncbi:DODA-type extradiol aromatic ring-opening family dioxygenase [Marinobacter daepoensis]|uniref:DODA-type extradiol aromatic ring-opening family dioxygenase n=1 Tax=Marinobacter daepoensis TaxID=262077 RepID=UPI00040F5A96|nr:class III extradiol ring-cleavage dioxygenase [Marinobacter daepoensis]